MANGQRARRGVLRSDPAPRWLRTLAALLLAALCLGVPGAIAQTPAIGPADGSFESGLGGMVVEGDASVVTSFGALFPTEGNRALLMTTAPDAGSTPADADSSAVRIEDFTVPAEFVQLRMDYVFMTDEPLPSRTKSGE